MDVEIRSVFPAIASNKAQAGEVMNVLWLTEGELRTLQQAIQEFSEKKGYFAERSEPSRLLMQKLNVFEKKNRASRLAVVEI